MSALIFIGALIMISNFCVIELKTKIFIGTFNFIIIDGVQFNFIIDCGSKFKIENANVLYFVLVFIQKSFNVYVFVLSYNAEFV